MDPKTDLPEAVALIAVFESLRDSYNNRSREMEHSFDTRLRMSSVADAYGFCAAKLTEALYGNAETLNPSHKQQ